MRGVVGLLLFLGAPALAFDATMTAGLGIEARIGNEVSPQNTNEQTMGQLYVSVAHHPWSVLWELGVFPNQTSGAGNYTVANQTYSTLLWGRYEPWSEYQVSPYFGLGVGQEFTKVTTQFGSAHDERWTDGGLNAGLCAGAMTTLWQRWNIEGEFQLLRNDLSSGFAYGVALRTGFTF